MKESVTTKAELITDSGIWDEFVEASPYGLLFHRWDFLKIMEKYSGYKFLPYGIYDNGEPACLMPLFFRSHLGLRFVHSPPPKVKVSYPGFVLSPAYATWKTSDRERFASRIADQLDGIARALRPNYLSILTPSGHSDVRPFVWKGYRVKIGYEYCTDLRSPLDELWSAMTSNCRVHIKSIAKRPMTLRESTDVEKLVEIMINNNTPKSRPLFYGNTVEYIRELMATFPDNVRLYLLYDGDRAVGTALNYHYKDRYVRWISSAMDGYSEYLEWEFIRQAKEMGFRYFEDPHADTMRLVPYKSKFNPHLEMDFNIYRKDAAGALLSWKYSKVFHKTI